MRACVAFGVLVVGGCNRTPDPAWARTPSQAVRGESTIGGEPAPIARCATPPTFVGKLDDPCWQSTGALGPLVDPGGGGEARADHPVAAFARFAYDDTKLYLAFVVRDRDPATPFGRDDIDPHVWGKSSAVEVMLQPGDFADNRDYYEFQVDTAGAIFDSHFDDYNAPITGTGPAKVFGHQDWSAHAERASFVSKGHFYSIEVAIPWSAYAPGRTPIPPHAGDVWKADIYSFRDGQRLALAWSPLKGQGNFHRTTRFGRIKFQ
jgi:hypothetical protein